MFRQKLCRLRWLAAIVILYVLYQWQDSTYHGLCYTCRGALAITRNSSVGSPWGIDPTTICTMSGHSTTQLRLSLTYIHTYTVHILHTNLQFFYVRTLHSSYTHSNHISHYFTEYLHPWTGSRGRNMARTPESSKRWLDQSELGKYTER